MKKFTFYEKIRERALLIDRAIGRAHVDVKGNHACAITAADLRALAQERLNTATEDERPDAAAA